MQTTQPAYFSQYRSLKLTRDDKGVLVAEFHSNGGPFTFSLPKTIQSFSTPSTGSRKIERTRSSSPICLRRIRHHHTGAA
jgi:hypothetical protein